MIQRKQTLFLLIASLAMACTLILPLANLMGGDVQVRLTAFGLQTIGLDGEPVMPYAVAAPYMGILLCLCSILPLITIFLFKKRWIQIRFCVVEMVLLAGAQGMIVVYLLRSRAAVIVFQTNTIAYSPVDLMPLVALFFTYLAMQGIFRDDTLVKSLNRIR